jgi:hypothetical protein
LSPISVDDYLYEVSFPDPLDVPRGHILQVAAKQHVISTHSRGSSDAHHEGLRKSGSQTGPRTGPTRGRRLPQRSASW